LSAMSEKTMRPRPCEVLLDQDRIARRIEQLGTQISADYAGKQPVLVGVLKGAAVFVADLMRQVTIPIELEFIHAASYRQGTRRGETLTLGGTLSVVLKGRHVLLVEGVVDTGRTVSRILERIRSQEPASVEIVTLLDKPASHRTKLSIKYKGFTIGNEFVIGYGMDNAQQYRNLPFIGRVVDG